MLPFQALYLVVLFRKQDRIAAGTSEKRKPRQKVKRTQKRLTQSLHIPLVDGYAIKDESANNGSEDTSRDELHGYVQANNEKNSGSPKEPHFLELPPQTKELGQESMRDGDEVVQNIPVDAGADVIDQKWECNLRERNQEISEKLPLSGSVADKQDEVCSDLAKSGPVMDKNEAELKSRPPQGFHNESTTDVALSVGPASSKGGTSIAQDSKITSCAVRNDVELVDTEVTDFRMFMEKGDSGIVEDRSPVTRKSDNLQKLQTDFIDSKTGTATRDDVSKMELHGGHHTSILPPGKFAHSYENRKSSTSTRIKEDPRCHVRFEESSSLLTVIKQSEKQGATFTTMDENKIALQYSETSEVSHIFRNFDSDRNCLTVLAEKTIEHTRLSKTVGGLQPKSKKHKENKSTRSNQELQQEYLGHESGTYERNDEFSCASEEFDQKSQPPIITLDERENTHEITKIPPYNSEEIRRGGPITKNTSKSIDEAQIVEPSSSDAKLNARKTDNSEGSTEVYSDGSYTEAMTGNQEPGVEGRIKDSLTEVQSQHKNKMNFKPAKGYSSKKKGRISEHHCNPIDPHEKSLLAPKLKEEHEVSDDQNSAAETRYLKSKGEAYYTETSHKYEVQEVEKTCDIRNYVPEDRGSKSHSELGNEVYFAESASRYRIDKLERSRDPSTTTSREDGSISKPIDADKLQVIYKEEDGGPVWNSAIEKGSKIREKVNCANPVESAGPKLEECHYGRNSTELKDSNKSYEINDSSQSPIKCGTHEEENNSSMIEQDPEFVNSMHPKESTATSGDDMNENNHNVCISVSEQGDSKFQKQTNTSESPDTNCSTSKHFNSIPVCHLRTDTESTAEEVLGVDINESNDEIPTVVEITKSTGDSCSSVSEKQLSKLNLKVRSTEAAVRSRFLKEMDSHNVCYLTVEEYSKSGEKIQFAKDSVSLRVKKKEGKSDDCNYAEEGHRLKTKDPTAVEKEEETRFSSAMTYQDSEELYNPVKVSSTERKGSPSDAFRSATDEHDSTPPGKLYSAAETNVTIKSELYKDERSDDVSAVPSEEVVSKIIEETGTKMTVAREKEEGPQRRDSAKFLEDQQLKAEEKTRFKELSVDSELNEADSIRDGRKHHCFKPGEKNEIGEKSIKMEKNKEHSAMSATSELNHRYRSSMEDTYSGGKTNVNVKCEVQETGTSRGGRNCPSKEPDSTSNEIAYPGKIPVKSVIHKENSAYDRSSIAVKMIKQDSISGAQMCAKESSEQNSDGLRTSTMNEPDTKPTVHTNIRKATVIEKDEAQHDTAGLVTKEQDPSSIKEIHSAKVLVDIEVKSSKEVSVKQNHQIFKSKDKISGGKSTITEKEQKSYDCHSSEAKGRESKSGERTCSSKKTNATITQEVDRDEWDPNSCDSTPEDQSDKLVEAQIHFTEFPVNLGIDKDERDSIPRIVTSKEPNFNYIDESCALKNQVRKMVEDGRDIRRSPLEDPPFQLQDRQHSQHPAKLVFEKAEEQSCDSPTSTKDVQDSKLGEQCKKEIPALMEERSHDSCILTSEKQKSKSKKMIHSTKDSAKCDIHKEIVNDNDHTCTTMEKGPRSRGKTQSSEASISCVIKEREMINACSNHAAIEQYLKLSEPIKTEKIIAIEKKEENHTHHCTPAKVQDLEPRKEKTAEDFSIQRKEECRDSFTSTINEQGSNPEKKKCSAGKTNAAMKPGRKKDPSTHAVCASTSRELTPKNGEETKNKKPTTMEKDEGCSDTSRSATEEEKTESGENSVHCEKPFFKADIKKEEVTNESRFSDDLKSIAKSKTNTRSKKSIKIGKEERSNNCANSEAKQPRPKSGGISEARVFPKVKTQSADRSIKSEYPHHEEGNSDDHNSTMKAQASKSGALTLSSGFTVDAGIDENEKNRDDNNTSTSKEFKSISSKQNQTVNKDTNPQKRRDSTEKHSKDFKPTTYSATEKSTKSTEREEDYRCTHMSAVPESSTKHRTHEKKRSDDDRDLNEDFPDFKGQELFTESILKPGAEEHHSISVDQINFGEHLITLTLPIGEKHYRQHSALEKQNPKISEQTSSGMSGMIQKEKKRHHSSTTTVKEHESKLRKDVHPEKSAIICTSHEEGGTNEDRNATNSGEDSESRTTTDIAKDSVNSNIRKGEEIIDFCTNISWQEHCQSRHQEGAEKNPLTTDQRHPGGHRSTNDQQDLNPEERTRSIEEDAFIFGIRSHSDSSSTPKEQVFGFRRETDLTESNAKEGTNEETSSCNAEVMSLKKLSSKSKERNNSEKADFAGKKKEGHHDSGRRETKDQDSKLREKAHSPRIDVNLGLSNSRVIGLSSEFQDLKPREQGSSEISTMMEKGRGRDKSLFSEAKEQHPRKREKSYSTEKTNTVDTNSGIGKEKRNCDAQISTLKEFKSNSEEQGKDDKNPVPEKEENDRGPFSFTPAETRHKFSDEFHSDEHPTGPTSKKKEENHVTQSSSAKKREIRPREQNSSNNCTAVERKRGQRDTRISEANEEAFRSREETHFAEYLDSSGVHKEEGNSDDCSSIVSKKDVGVSSQTHPAEFSADFEVDEGETNSNICTLTSKECDFKFVEQTDTNKATVIEQRNHYSGRMAAMEQDLKPGEISRPIKTPNAPGNMEEVTSSDPNSAKKRNSVSREQIRASRTSTVMQTEQGSHESHKTSMSEHGSKSGNKIHPLESSIKSVVDNEEENQDAHTSTVAEEDSKSSYPESNTKRGDRDAHKSAADNQYSKPRDFRTSKGSKEEFKSGGDKFFPEEGNTMVISGIDKEEKIHRSYGDRDSKSRGRMYPIESTTEFGFDEGEGNSGFCITTKILASNADNISALENQEDYYSDNSSTEMRRKDSRSSGSSETVGSKTKNSENNGLSSAREVGCRSSSTAVGASCEDHSNSLNEVIHARKKEGTLLHLSQTDPIAEEKAEKRFEHLDVRLSVPLSVALRGAQKHVLPPPPPPSLSHPPPKQPPPQAHPPPSHPPPCETSDLSTKDESMHYHTNIQSYFENENNVVNVAAKESFVESNRVEIPSNEFLDQPEGEESKQRKDTSTSLKVSGTNDQNRIGNTEEVIVRDAADDSTTIKKNEFGYNATRSVTKSTANSVPGDRLTLANTIGKNSATGILSAAAEAVNKEHLQAPIDENVSVEQLQSPQCKQPDSVSKSRSNSEKSSKHRKFASKQSDEIKTLTEGGEVNKEELLQDVRCKGSGSNESDQDVGVEEFIFITGGRDIIPNSEEAEANLNLTLRSSKPPHSSVRSRTRDEREELKQSNPNESSLQESTCTSSSANTERADRETSPEFSPHMPPTISVKSTLMPSSGKPTAPNQDLLDEDQFPGKGDNVSFSPNEGSNVFLIDSKTEHPPLLTVETSVSSSAPEKFPNSHKQQKIKTKSYVSKETEKLLRKKAKTKKKNSTSAERISSENIAETNRVDSSENFSVLSSKNEPLSQESRGIQLATDPTTNLDIGGGQCEDVGPTEESQSDVAEQQRQKNSLSQQQQPCVSKSMKISEMNSEEDFAPLFLQRTQIMKCVEGEALTVDVFLKARPQPKISVYVNDRYVTCCVNQVEPVSTPEHNLYSFTFPIDCVRPEDGGGGGQLMFKATNPLGIDECTTYLQIAEKRKPKFSKFNEKTLFEREFEAAEVIWSVTDMTVAEGGTAWLYGKLCGFPVPELIWLKNGVEIDQERSERKYRTELKSDGTFALEIAKCTVDDEDVYELIVENMAGVDSCLFKLSVDDSATEKEHQKQRRQKHGLRDEVLLSDSERQEPKGRRVRKIVERKNFNVLSSTQSIAPRFGRALEDREATAGEVVELKVEIHGDPQPCVCFYRNGRVLSGSEKCEIRHVGENVSQHYLVLKNIEENEAGEYACHALNSAGEAWCYSNVIVRPCLGSTDEHKETQQHTTPSSTVAPENSVDENKDQIKNDSKLDLRTKVAAIQKKSKRAGEKKLEEQNEEVSATTRNAGVKKEVKPPHSNHQTQETPLSPNRDASIMNTASNQANTTSSVHGSSSISNPEVITNVSSDSIINKTRLKEVQKEQLVDAAHSPNDQISSWKDPLKPENGKDSTSELQVEGNDGKESTNRTTNASTSAVSAVASSTKKKKKIPKALVIPFEISSRFGDPSILHSVANITANIKAPEGVAEAISPIKEPRSASISVKVGSIPKTRSKSETRQDPSVEFTFKQISQSRGPESGISRGVPDRQTAQLNPTEAFEVVTEGKAVAEKRTNRSINGKPKSIEAREHRDQTVSENTTNLDRMESEQEKEELHNEEVVTKQKTTQENRNESCTGVPEETYTQRNQATTAEYAELKQGSEVIALEDVTPKEVEQRKEQKKKEKKEKPKKEVTPLEEIRPKEEVKHKEVKPKEEVKPQERVGSKQEISKKKKEEKPQEKVESKEEINKKEKKEKPLEEPKPAEETENKEKNLKKDVKPKEGKPRKEVKFKEEKLKDEVKPKQEDNKKKKKEERNKEGVMSQVNKQNETDRASVTEKNDGQQEKMGTISWTEAEAHRPDKDGILSVYQDQSENESRMLGDVTASIGAYEDTANEDVIESIVLQTKKRKNFDKQFEKEYQTSEEEKMEQKEEDRMIIKGGEISMDEEKLESEHTEEYTEAYTVAMPTMKCEPSEEKAEETFIGQLVEKTGKEKNNKRGTKSKLSRSRLKKDSILEEMAGEPETTDEKMSLTAPIDERSANVPVSGILEENINIVSLQEILPTKINEKMTNENENCQESISEGKFEGTKKAKPIEKLEENSEVGLPPQKWVKSSDPVKEVSRTDGEVLQLGGDSLPQRLNLGDEHHTTTKRFDPSCTLRSDGVAEEPGTSQIVDVSEKNDSVDPSISGRAATEETVKIVKQLEPKQTYRKGDTVTLMIELDRETYEVEWYKDGEPIQVNEKCSVETNGVICKLTVENVDSTDSGNYTIVSNGSQSIAKISVSDAPRFTTEEMEDVINVKKDEHISFNIPFNCLTTPTLYCLKDGLPLQEESANHILEIRRNSVHFFKDKATKQDTGEYLVEISNQFGEDTRRITVHVKDVPNPPGNLTAKIIDSNKISLSWHGPELGWDDEKIVEYVIEAKEANRRRFREIAKIPAAKTEYILDNLEMGTCYTVRVKAVNVFGSSEPSEITNITTGSLLTLPRIAEPPVVSEITTDGCVLRWARPEDDSGGSPLLGYDVFLRIDSGEWKKINNEVVTGESYTVKNLHHSTNYEFKIEVCNEAGLRSDSGAVSKPLRLPAASNPPLTTPSVPRITVTGPDSVTLEWDTSDDDSVSTTFTVAYKSENSSVWKEVNCDSTFCKVDGLKEEVSYVFKVARRNEFGVSSFSEISQPIKVVCDSSPRILKAIHDVVVPRKETLRLECHAAGHPTPDYVWYKNGTEIIPQDAGTEIVNEGDKTVLIFHNVNDTDGGLYTCEAENKLGKIISEAEVTVGDVRHHFQSSFPEYNEAEIGADINLSCTVSDESGAVFWYKDGRKLKEDARVKISVDGDQRILRIQSIRATDGGTYRCETSDRRNWTEGELVVNDKMSHISVGPQDQIVKHFGDTIRLVCELSEPSDRLKWFKDGREIWQKHGKYEITTSGCMSTLEILAFEKIDAGTYHVSVDEREMSAPALLSLEVAPVIKIREQIEESISLNAGAALDFHIEYLGYPEPTVTIFHNDKLIQDTRALVEHYENVIRVCIKNLTLADRGAVKIVAENASGITRNEFYVNILDVPSAPTNLSAITVTTSSTTLTWKEPEETNGSPVIRFIVQRKKLGSTRWRTVGKTNPKTFCFDDLDVFPNQEYIFRVVAVNKVGEGPSSLPVNVLIPSDDEEEVTESSETLSVENTALVAPTSLVAEKNGDNICLSWNSVPMASFYKVERSNPPGNWHEIAVLEKTEYSDCSIMDNSPYAYRVTAIGANSSSTPSEPTLPITFVKERNSDPLRSSENISGGADVKEGEEESDPSFNVKELSENKNGANQCKFAPTNKKQKNEKTEEKPREEKKESKQVNEESEEKHEEEEKKEKIATKHSNPVDDIVNTKQRLKKRKPNVRKEKSSPQQDSQTNPQQEKIHPSSATATNETLPQTETSIDPTKAEEGTELLAGDMKSVSTAKDIEDIATPHDFVPADGNGLRTTDGVECTSLSLKNIKKSGYPIVSVESSEVKVKVGHPAKIAVTVQSSTDVQCLWKKDGLLIKNDKYHTLSYKDGVAELFIKEADVSNSGVYSMTAETGQGSDTAEVTLCVKGVPQLPSDSFRVAVIGSSCKLSWSAPQDDEKDPIVGYVIEKYDEKINEWMFLARSQTTNFITEKQECGSTQRFRIAAENTSGVGPFVESENIRIRPGTLALDLEKPEVTPTGVSIMAKWNPLPIDGVKYLVEIKEAKARRPWTAVTSVDGDSYTITGLTSGVDYTVRVTAITPDAQGSPSEESDVVKCGRARENEQPSFFLVPENTTVLKGAKMKLLAEFKGHPSPEIRWFKNRKEIFSGQRIWIETSAGVSSLTVSEMREDDEGDYTIVLSNAAGTTEHKFKLHMDALPEINRPDRYTSVLVYDEGETVKLRLSFSGT
ncbi:hypothetical protein RB195_012622 [Necator americanus]|uniref:Uncharacterized protein n=1 Tax=Necator americanus TaxID=51031 RepID=A0ABR1DRS6_NECAM